MHGGDAHRQSYQTLSPSYSKTMKTTKQIEQELAVTKIASGHDMYKSFERAHPEVSAQESHKIGRVEKAAPWPSVNKPVRYVPRTPFGTGEDEGQKDTYFIENKR